MNRKTLKKVVGESLTSAGFKKKGQAWYLDNPDLIGVLELQKCDWGYNYFVNIGFYIRALGQKDDFPHERMCHLRYRVESIFHDLHIEICKMLIVHEDGDIESRLEQLQDLLTNRIVPFFMSVRTISDLKRISGAAWFPNGFLHVDARSFLGLAKR